ncbi:MAG: hypothetical protein H0Z39_07370 [Peptococcaceae bacterium]|nr:hypothetical protein [Peptococcaceae bacterium]
MRKKVARLLKEQDGAAAVIMALFIVVATGFAGLAIDIGYLEISKYKIQTAVDAACLAAAQELPDTGMAAQKAREYAAANGLDPSTLTLEFSDNNRQVTVSAHQDIKPYFMPLFGIDNLRVGSRGAARAGVAPHVFAYSLFSGSASEELRFSGNGLTVDGSVHTNHNFRVSGNHIIVTRVSEACGTIRSRE